MQFFITPSHVCSYLPPRKAINVFADPFADMHMGLYSRLIEAGFRRSGRHVYRPHCPGCQSCIATRIPVSTFNPDRSQRRNLKANRGLEARELDPEFRPEHFELYRNYVNTRHAGGEMENPTPDSYRSFLRAAWSDTRFVEFREGNRLVSVSVVDRVQNGISAVYTYYEPELSSRGLGVYAVLWQIQEALRCGLPYVYLGYWISGHPKMGYKFRFKPIEGLISGRWQRIDSAAIARQQPVDAAQRLHKTAGSCL
jgi:leucyl-tRNA---protein transferase